MTHLKRPWCWERLRAGGEGDDRGWDGWTASPTQWTWVCIGSGSWWRTGRPGVLLFLGSQRVGHDWVTDLNWVRGKCGLCQIRQCIWHNRSYIPLWLWVCEAYSHCYLTHPMDSFSTTLSLGCSLHPHYQHSAFTLLYLFSPQKGRVKVLNVLPQLALEGYLTRWQSSAVRW